MQSRNRGVYEIANHELVAEGADLLVVFHLNCDSYSAASPPAAILVGPGEIVQILCGTLIASRDFDYIPQINGTVLRGRRSSDDYFANLLRRDEFA